MTAELCPTCGIWWRGVEHSCRLPISSTTTNFDPEWGAISKAELARLRKIEEAAREHGACTCEHYPGYPRGHRHAPQCDDDPILRAALREEGR